MWIELKEMVIGVFNSYFDRANEPAYNAQVKACREAANLIQSMQPILIESFDKNSEFNQFLKHNPQAKEVAEQINESLKPCLLKSINRRDGNITFEMDMFLDALVMSEKTQGFSVQQYLYLNDSDLVDRILAQRYRLERLHNLYNEDAQRDYSALNSSPPLLIDFNRPEQDFELSEHLVDKIVSLKI